jgi:hypothetical protein
VYKNRRGEAEIKPKEKICRGKYDTHNIKWAGRVKCQNLILILWAGLDGSPGSKNCARKSGNNTTKHELENECVQN